VDVTDDHIMEDKRTDTLREDIYAGI